MTTLLSLAIAASLALPITARADTFDIHVGGICSTDFGATLGHWAGETSINAPADRSASAPVFPHLRPHGVACTVLDHRRVRTCATMLGGFDTEREDRIISTGDL